MSRTPSQVRPSRMILLGVTILLLSGCGGDGGSGGGLTGGACQTNCPTAEAGPQQTVLMGAPVTLDGSGSTSGTEGVITYQWTLMSKPAGSAATLAGATTARPTFTADVAGTYAARLVVQEGGVASPPDTVTITCGTGNLAPIADAGLDRTERLGTPVTMDGTGSRDPNSAPLTYAWRFVTQPSGSQAVLLTPTSKTPSFTPQVTGPYTLALTVSDGTLTSPSDEVVITVTSDNSPPVAHAGADQQVPTGRVVTLSGAGSTDPNDDPVTYSWRFQSTPAGSTATIAAATAVSPTFTADRAGLYVLSLVVSDGMRTSAPDSVVVEARLPSTVGGVLQAYIKASNTTVPEFRSFGERVALDGNTLVVSASDPSCATGPNGNQANSSCNNAGAVYVFTRTGETWSQQAYLKASNTNAGDQFGAAVSLSGDTLAVGAVGEGSCARGINGDQANNSCQGAGAVYVFTRTGGTWSQQSYLKASNTTVGSGAFGNTVSLSGNTLAVGAWLETSCATGINGDQANTGCVQSGAVYIFRRNDNVWTQEAYVKASNAQSLDTFGFIVALVGDSLAVGATEEGGAGAVYVFTRTAGAWTQQAYVKGSNSSAGDQFGIGLALTDDTLIVGARLEDSCATGINGNQADEGCDGAGAVYIFTRANNLWSQVAYVKPHHAGAQGSNFGSNVAFDGTTVAVTSLDPNCARGVNPSPGSNDCGFSGAVYLFTRTATSWAQRAYVKASNTEAFDFFGYGLAIAGNTLVAGAPFEDSCATGINGNQDDNNCTGFPPDFGTFPPPTFGAGAVYVYVLQQN